MQNDFVIKKMISTIQVEFFGGFLARCNRTWGMESEKTYYNQFYFVLKGECKIKIGDDEYIVRENQMILLPKDIPIVSSLTESCELIKYWCGFTASVSDINFFDMVETKYLIDVDDINYVESLFEGMLHKRNFTNSEADILEQKAFLLRLIAYYLERSFVKRVYATSTGVDFEPVLRYMQENMSQKISIPYLAEMMHFNQDYFTRVFKKLFACTPTKFLEQMRLDEAARLIMTTSKSISEIAMMVGIEDVYYFSRFFKQRQLQSMSPSQFRRVRKGSVIMNSKIFGETLQKIRKDKNLSVEELAESIGISPYHLRSMESGKRLPSLPVFVDLANELKIKSDELLTGNVACADVLQINEVTREMLGMTFKQKNMVKEIFDVCKRYFNDR